MEVEKWKAEEGVKILRRIGFEPEQIVLDFGCRTGNYTILASKIVGEGGKVYALDKNPEALDKLMQRAEVEGLKNIQRIDVSEELEIPLENESVDVVLAYDVIHLIGWEENKGETVKRSTAADRRILYKEIYRVAKPGALISVYPTHLTTHTDVKSNSNIRAEIEDSGFSFERDFTEILIHNDNLTSGHILNFKK